MKVAWIEEPGLKAFYARVEAALPEPWPDLERFYCEMHGLAPQPVGSRIKEDMLDVVEAKREGRNLEGLAVQFAGHWFSWPPQNKDLAEFLHYAETLERTVLAMPVIARLAEARLTMDLLPAAPTSPDSN